MNLAQTLIRDIAGIVTALGIITAALRLWGGRIFAAAIRTYLRDAPQSDFLLNKHLAEVLDRQKHLEQQLEQIKEYQDRNLLAILQDRILRMITTTPDKAQLIEECYTEYKTRGGNGYIDATIQEWRTTHEREIIRRRIKAEHGPRHPHDYLTSLG